MASDFYLIQYDLCLIRSPVGISMKLINTITKLSGESIKQLHWDTIKIYFEYHIAKLAVNIPRG